MRSRLSLHAAIDIGAFFYGATGFSVFFPFVVVCAFFYLAECEIKNLLIEKQQRQRQRVQ
jgi:hypothetical protein